MLARRSPSDEQACRTHVTSLMRSARCLMPPKHVHREQTLRFRGGGLVGDVGTENSIKPVFTSSFRSATDRGRRVLHSCQKSLDSRRFAVEGPSTAWLDSATQKISTGRNAPAFPKAGPLPPGLRRWLQNRPRRRGQITTEYQSKRHLRSL